MVVTERELTADAEVMDIEAFRCWFEQQTGIKVCRRTWYSWIEREMVPSWPLGSRRFIRKADAERLVRDGVSPRRGQKRRAR